jgi:hypothetical protein
MIDLICITSRDPQVNNKEVLMNTLLRLAFVGVAILVGMALAAQPALAQDGAEPAAPVANPTVTIGHFAPFAADLAGTAVDVKVNGTRVFTNVVYGNFVPDVAFAAGATLVELMTPGTETVIISNTTTLEADKRYYLLAIGGANAFPLTLIWTPRATTIPAGKALITLGHLAPVTGLTSVNVCTDGGQLVATLNYGAPQANLPLDPGFHDWKIWVVGCTFFELFDMPPFYIPAGDYRDGFAVGLQDSIVFPPNIVSTTGLMTIFNFLPTIQSGAVE